MPSYMFSGAAVVEYTDAMAFEVEADSLEEAKKLLEENPEKYHEDTYDTYHKETKWDTLEGIRFDGEAD